MARARLSGNPAWLGCGRHGRLVPRKGYVDAANRLRDPQEEYPWSTPGVPLEYPWSTLGVPSTRPRDPHVGCCCASRPDPLRRTATNCARARASVPLWRPQVQARVRAKLPAAVRRAYAQIVTGKLDMRAETARAAARPRALSALRCVGCGACVRDCSAIVGHSAESDGRRAPPFGTGELRRCVH